MLTQKHNEHQNIGCLQWGIQDLDKGGGSTLILYGKGGSGGHDTVPKHLGISARLKTGKSRYLLLLLHL